MPVIGSRNNISGTWLNWVGSKLNEVGNWFGTTSNRVRDVFLLGEYLYDAFRSIGHIFKDAASYINNAENLIRYYLNYVSDIIEGYGFLDLVDWASSNYQMIRVNPMGWIYLQLGKIGPYAILAVSNPLGLLKTLIIQISWTFDWLWNNPVGLIDYLFGLNRGWTRQFLDDPVTLIISWLSYYLSDFWTLLTNPLEFIKQRVRLLIPQFDMLMFNPVAWIIWLLNQVNPHMAAFVANPDLYLKGQVISYFGFPASFWSNPKLFLGEYILDSITNWFDTFEDRLKDIFIKFILRFI